MPPYHEMVRIIMNTTGYCFVDFAASAPYVDIDMHPADPMERIDAAFFSPHKFLEDQAVQSFDFQPSAIQNETPTPPEEVRLNGQTGGADTAIFLI